MPTSLVTDIFVQPRFRELALFPGSFFRYLRHSWLVHRRQKEVPREQGFSSTASVMM